MDRMDCERNDSPIRSIALAAGGIVALREDGSAAHADINLNEWQEIPDLRGARRAVGGPDRVVVLMRNPVAAVLGNNWEIRHIWPGARDISACEGHYGMVSEGGTVFCMDDDSRYDGVLPFSEMVRDWKDIAQLALTYDEPYALTTGGKLLCRNEGVMRFFNDADRRITQIAAFRRFDSLPTIAALYEDGTAKALLDEEEIGDVRNWYGVCRICCADGVVLGLDGTGTLLIPVGCEYRDGAGRKFDRSEGIADMDARDEYLVCLRNDGEILVLRRK